MVIIVLSVISVPISLVIGQYSMGFRKDENRIFAIQIARQELEKIHNTKYEDIEDLSDPEYKYGDGDEERTYAVDVNVTYKEGYETADESLKKIEVEVSYGGDPDEKIKFTAYRCKNVSF